ncbi:MAG: hypothetical protein AAGF77_07270 [Bacteroidota bacterium]
MKSDLFIDLHCHSTLKPYSRSFKEAAHTGQNTADITEEHSVWYMDHEVLTDKISNVLLSVTRFTQADFKTSYHGGVKVIMVSIDPMEKALVYSKKGNRQIFTGQWLKNFIIGIGRPRIKNLFELTDYYKDLYATYDYLKQLDGQFVQLGDQKVRYKLVDRYADIDVNDKQTLYVVMTIEGGHVFNTGLQLANVITDVNQVLNNIKDLKSDRWAVKPFFVAIAHHFPNQLCGHARSFKGISTLAYDQKADKKQGITTLGLAVIKRLLQNDGGQKRIYIDVKHMNPRSRFAYYNLLNSEAYRQEGIPIIVSHGALKFMKKPDRFTDDINFYNEEIVYIAKSQGIFGVQMDERRLLKRKPKMKKRDQKQRPKRLLYRKAYYVWRQIEAMALLLYKDPAFNGDCWGIQAIGSDFDGIIDPLNGYWTHNHLSDLAHYLRLHAYNFLYTETGLALPDRHLLNAETIIEKFCFGNAQRFLAAYLK